MWRPPEFTFAFDCQRVGDHQGGKERTVQAVTYEAALLIVKERGQQRCREPRWEIGPLVIRRCGAPTTPRLLRVNY